MLPIRTDGVCLCGATEPSYGCRFFYPDGKGGMTEDPNEVSSFIESEEIIESAT